MEKVFAVGLAIASILFNVTDSKAHYMELKYTSQSGKDPREQPASLPSQLRQTDPELFGVFENFVGEVSGYGDLDDETRLMAILASTIASRSLNQFEITLEGAIDAGVSPEQAKEIVYQAVPYVGMSGVMDFIELSNKVLTRRGIALPLEGQSRTSPETRFERGLAVQKEIFGERIEDNYRNSPSDQLHIQRFLSANCFGDYVARGGLDLKTREMLTFSMLLTLGGCEPQLKGHIQGNVNVGNDKKFLLAVVTQLIPYVGYPRALNAIACLNEVIPE